MTVTATAPRTHRTAIRSFRERTSERVGGWSEALFLVTAMAGVALLIVGSYMPWASFYYGLIERNGVSGHGKYFIGLAAAAGLAALFSTRRGVEGVRLLVPAAGLLVGAAALRDLRNLRQFVDDPQAQLFLPEAADGLYVVLAGAALLLAAFFVAPRFPSMRALRGFALPVAFAVAAGAGMLTAGLLGEYYLHLASGGHQHGHTSALNPAHLLTFSGGALLFAAFSATVLRAGARRRAG